MSTAALADTTRIVRPLAPLRRFLAADKGAWWDFGAAATNADRREFTPADAETLLRDWTTRAEPPILREHDPARDGWGWVTGILRVAESEAAAMGIASQDGDWLYAEIAALPRLAKAIDDGTVRLVSPHLVRGYTDDEGRAWPLVLTEVSFVAAPRLRTQPRPEELDAAQLSDTPMKIKGRRIALANHAGEVLATGPADAAMMSDLAPEDIVTVTDAETGEVLMSGTVAEVTDATEMEDDGATDAGAPMADPATLQAKLDAAPPDVRDAAIRAAMDVLTAGAAMTDPDKTEGAAMADKTETAALRRELAEMKARLEAQRIDAEVAAVMSDRVLPPGQGREDAVYFAKLGAEAFAKWAAGLPKRARLQTERAKMSDATPAGAAARPGEDPAVVRAFASANKIGYAQALRSMGAGQ